MKLETSIRELHEMFMDMAMFVETQVTRHLPDRARVRRVLDAACSGQESPGLVFSLKIQELIAVLMLS
jgi:hypothetical protein